MRNKPQIDYSKIGIYLDFADIPTETLDSFKLDVEAKFETIKKQFPVAEWRKWAVGIYSELLVRYYLDTQGKQYIVQNPIDLNPELYGKDSFDIMTLDGLTIDVKTESFAKATYMNISQKSAFDRHIDYYLMAKFDSKLPTTGSFICWNTLDDFKGLHIFGFCKGEDMRDCTSQYPRHSVMKHGRSVKQAELTVRISDDFGSENIHVLNNNLGDFLNLFDKSECDYLSGHMTIKVHQRGITQPTEAYEAIEVMASLYNAQRETYIKTNTAAMKYKSSESLKSMVHIDYKVDNLDEHTYRMYQNKSFDINPIIAEAMKLGLRKNCAVTIEGLLITDDAYDRLEPLLKKFEIYIVR